MVKKGPKPQEVKSYVPSKWLKSFLDEKLLLLKKNESSRTWDKKKVDNIDKLFEIVSEDVSSGKPIQKLMENNHLDVAIPLEEKTKCWGFCKN